MSRDQVKDIIDRDTEDRSKKVYRKKVMSKKAPSKNVVEVDYENKKVMAQPVYKENGKPRSLDKKGEDKDFSKLDTSKPNKRPRSVEKVSVIKYEPASDKKNRFSDDLDVSSEKYIRSMNKLEKKMRKKD